MAATSVRWSLVTGFCDLLKEHPDLSGVGVHPVWPGDKNVTPEMIVADTIEGDVSMPVMVAGRKHRDDQFTVTFQILIASHKASFDEAMVRLFEVVAAFQDIVAEDPTLGDMDGIVSAEVQSERQWPVSTPEGALAGGEVVIAVHARLT